MKDFTWYNTKFSQPSFKELYGKEMGRIADLTLNYIHCILFFKCNLRELTTKSIQRSLVFCICACIWIPCALHWRHSCMCFKCVFAALFGVTAHHPGSFPHPFPPSFHCFFSVMGAFFPFLHGGSWLSCQDLPAMGDIPYLRAGCQ